MASFLYRIGRASYRRWYIVVTAWLGVLVVAGGLAAAFSAPAASSFTIPGIPSERAQDLLTERFPSDTGEDPQTAPTFKMVVATPDSSPLTSPENQEKVARVLESIREIPGLAAPEAVGTLGLPAEALESG
jgi:RND superfamily putative drug exporter